MSKFIGYVLCIGLLAGAATVSAETLKVVTGSQGGQWYPLGGALKAVVEERNPELRLQVLPGGGVSNVIAIDQGKADIGITFNVSTVDGMAGADPFPEATQDVCHLATLFPSFYQLVTISGSGIGDLGDVGNASLTTSKRGSTTEGINRQLLGVLGLDYDDLNGTSFTSFTDSVSLMKDGNADLFIVGTSVPTAAVMDLASSRSVSLLPMTGDIMARMREINAGYIEGVIPAGTYPGHDTDVPAIEFATQIIVRCSLENDIVAALANALHEGVEDLVSVNAGMRGLGPVEFSRDVGVPLHPAAAKYWAEAQ
ncbi:TAXI family TRAP transporter solute-binding subunit [Roseobacter sp. YSTF-M11]|uniref:TAXI family TRAP transporter solute-binding subunit n=1 Tax=Roseobacter insulae TaxID=2859783 RepID=A0A9X1FRP8_9RHOB|nr:TAXI family TRAP transporter solute-binding subunit [Roseobacter insulae]MBW4706357.1 TAXI family TRAP transporter solute-binding subunit [Roseobacter insulae]